ncbi:MAG TPA: RNA polymerase sigma-70 factor [Chitinophagaceae bacterium]|nr:RNA polymerase sigma-70 factor [Chitinophagaceae bacterium]
MDNNSIHIERALAMRVANGDEHAFRVLYDTYYDLVYRRAFTFLHSSELASDVVQEVFIKIWNYRAKLPEINNIKNFIFVVARNQIITDLRRKALVSYNVNEDADVAEDESFLPDNQLSLKQVRAIVNDAIEQLTPQQKIAFKLSRNEGLSYAEIAKQMELSPLTVKTHISKAIQSIRQYLDSHATDLSMILFLFLMKK